MVLLGEEAQVEDRFSPFRDSGNINARWVNDFQAYGTFGANRAPILRQYYHNL